MVRYPDGCCPRCGERIYTSTESELWCPNCTYLEHQQRAAADSEAPAPTGFS